MKVRKETEYYTVGDSEDPDNPETEIEETRYYTADSYDENLNVIGYNSEFKDAKSGKVVGIVDFHTETGENRIRYCPHCEEYGFKNLLGVLLVRLGSMASVPSLR